MKKTTNNWVWFLAFMLMIVSVGIFLGYNRRRELGKNFEYPLDELRAVDAALILYRELEPLTPDIRLGQLKCISVSADDRVFVGGQHGLQELPEQEPMLIDQTEIQCLTMDEGGHAIIGRVNSVQDVGKDRTWGIPGEKAFLTSIAVDERYVYAADAGNRVIWRLDRLGKTDPQQIGRKDEKNGIRGFFIPSPYFDVAVSMVDGSIWAVNPGLHIFENYSNEGRLLSSWKAESRGIEGFSGCCNPSHFAILPDGGFVTAEKGLPRVKVHNTDGSLRCVVAEPEQFNEGIVGLDIATESTGKIYVLDPQRHQVRVFEEKR